MIGRKALFSCLVLLVCSNTFAQIDSARYDQVRSLTKFYEYLLNTLGDKATSTRDKQVIISESFTKVFEDAEVQVEDDLLPDRQVVTNKDVQAYLQDVDFFFQDVAFSFENLVITKEQNPAGTSYFKVSFESVIEGITLEGKAFQSTTDRFLEINLNEEMDDLKIVSVYSTKVTREEELRAWWESLSFGWVNVFEKIVSFDSLTTEKLFEIADLDSLDLSANPYLINIKPLAALKNLTYVNISGTMVADLSPLRYSTELKSLQAEKTPISNVQSINTLTNIATLNLKDSGIEKLDGLGQLQDIRTLNLSGTEIANFQQIAQLKNLEKIDLSNTSFADFSLLQNNRSLASIMLDNTKITELKGISNLKILSNLEVANTPLLDVTEVQDHPALQEVNLSGTFVNTLTSFERIKNLKKIIADNTPINDSTALSFMNQFPEVVVITNGAASESWWNALPSNWKKALMLENPTREQLTLLLNKDSLDLSNHPLKDGEPLAAFSQLRFLDISHTQISDLSPLNQLVSLTAFKAEKTPITSLEKLQGNTVLTEISLQNSEFTDVGSLTEFKKLSYLNLEETPANTDEIEALMRQIDGVVIYQTTLLETWYSSLNTAWQAATPINENDSYALHQWTQKESLSINDQPIKDLSPLYVFKNLAELTLEQVAISSFQTLPSLTTLTKISCKNSPLQSLNGLQKLTKLQSLQVANTAIDDLAPLANLSDIKTLDLSGTAIRRVRDLANLRDLRELNISNTRVFRLDKIYHLKKLSSLSCFNTKLRANEVADFQLTLPDCKVVFY